MAGRENAKLKLLYLADILTSLSDEQHPLTANELCFELAKYGVGAERKAVYNDIDALRTYGMDIIQARSPKQGFFLGERRFEMAEIRLLIDAVQAANFISVKKTNALIKKIESFVSQEQARTLRSQVYVDRRPKCKNEEIYYTIDSLDRAIKENKQVSFIYKKRMITPKYTYGYEEKAFTVNPYAMIWSNDHYYLVCNNPKYDNLMHVRIDRIRSLEVLELASRNFSEISKYKAAFDSADYANTLFNMYSGELKTLELICDNSLIEAINDRFGENIPVIAMNERVFRVCVNAAVSDGLVSWLMQYGDKIIVNSPDALRRMVREKAEKILDVYR